MPHRSPHPDVDIPDVPLTDYVLEHAAARGDRPALVDGVSGRTITYAELPVLVRRAAAGLAARGFGRGDVLAIWSPNLPEFAVAIHAVATLGGTVTTANPLYTVAELAAQLDDSRARAILTVPPLLESARAAARQAGIDTLYVFGDVPADFAAGPERATAFADLLATDGPVPAVTIDPREDVVFLPYSSGTTGVPKGVMLTHRNIVANIAQTTFAGARVITPDDRAMGILPFFHIYGLVPILNAALRLGATLVTMPRFELEPFLRVLVQQRVTVAHVVPPIVLALAKHPVVAQHDLSGLRLLFSGAAPLDASLAEAAAARLGCVVRQGYGMTESSPVTHFAIPEDEGAAGTVGSLVPNTEMRIVDLETGAEVAPGARGELQIRGPQVMKGYLGRPQATAETIDADGWLHTGDVATLDAEGRLRIVDRVKELIKYKGLQVAPAELEGILLSHPAIADAAVIPYPDDEAGEVPVAYVVPHPAVLPDDDLAATILAYVSERVAPYKRIRRLTFVDAIPKAASGKILRRVLVERARATARATAEARLPAAGTPAAVPPAG